MMHRQDCCKRQVVAVSMRDSKNALFLWCMLLGSLASPTQQLGDLPKSWLHDAQRSTAAMRRCLWSRSSYEPEKTRLRGGGGDTEDDMMRLGRDFANSAKAQKQALDIAREGDDKWMKKFVASYVDCLPADERSAAKENMQTLTKQFKSRVKAGALKNLKQKWPAGWTHPWSPDELHIDTQPASQGASETDIFIPSPEFPSINRAVAVALSPVAESGTGQPTRILVKNGNHTMDENSCTVNAVDEEANAELAVEGAQEGEGSAALVGQLELGSSSRGSLHGINVLWASEDEFDATLSVQGGPWNMSLCEVIAHGNTAVQTSLQANVTLCGCRVGGREGADMASSCGLLAVGGLAKLLQCDLEDVGGANFEAPAPGQKPLTLAEEESVWGRGAVCVRGAGMVCLVRCLFDRVGLAVAVSAHAKCSLLECEIRMGGRYPAITASGKRNHAEVAVVRSTFLASDIFSKHEDRPRDLREIDNVLKPPGWTLHVTPAPHLLAAT